jgi:Xaa-Pro dipeptidase
VAFSSAEHGRRWNAVRSLMAAQEVETLLVFGTRGAGHEVQYLAGYPVSGEALLVVPAAGNPVLLVHHYNHVPDARRLSVVEDVRPRGPDAIGAAVAQLTRGAAWGAVGLAGPLSFQAHQALGAALGVKRPLRDLGPGLTALRYRKSQDELALVRRGAALSDGALRALREAARPGVTERDLVAAVEGAYLPLGGSTHIHFLGATSMSNPDLCVPRQFPTGRRLAAGDVVLTELSAACEGYYGQVLRTLTVAAEPDEAYRRMHELAIAVYEEATARIRPGVRSGAVLEAGEAIHEAGYTICDDLLHFAVGGVYGPALRTRRTSTGPQPDFAFEEGMVLVVQPNVVTPDFRSGVQVGEMLVVTANGAESLHRVPREILRCG